MTSLFYSLIIPEKIAITKPSYLPDLIIPARIIPGDIDMIPASIIKPDHVPGMVHGYA
jgi:hypothetical protein